MKNIYLFLSAAILCCANTLNAQSAQDLIEKGNSVYIEINDIKKNTDGAYESFRTHLLSAEWNRWNLVESREEADFVCRLNLEKKGISSKALTSLRIWVITEILTPDGKSVWKSKKYRGNASWYTHGDALSDAMRKVIRRSLKVELYGENE